MNFPLFHNGLSEVYLIASAEVRSASPRRCQSVRAVDDDPAAPPATTEPSPGPLLSAEQPRTPLPLYGRPSVARRQRWYYYTIIAGGIKVLVRAGRRDCMEELGCDELYDGDTVDVPDAPPGAYTVRMYRYNRF